MFGRYTQSRGFVFPRSYLPRFLHSRALFFLLSLAQLGFLPCPGLFFFFVFPVISAFEFLRPSCCFPNGEPIGVASNRDDVDVRPAGTGQEGSRAKAADSRQGTIGFAKEGFFVRSFQASPARATFRLRENGPIWVRDPRAPRRASRNLAAAGHRHR